MSGSVARGWLLWVLVVGLLVVGCVSSGSGPGTVEVRVRDHREAIGDFRELLLTFSAVGIHPAGQPRNDGWTEMEPSIQELDLTQYVGEREAVIAQGMIEVGAYNAVRLGLEGAVGTLKDGQQVGVEVVLDPVALDFQVRPGRTIVLLLDLVVLDVSDHPGQGYELYIQEAIIK